MVRVCAKRAVRKTHRRFHKDNPGNKNENSVRRALGREKRRFTNTQGRLRPR